MREMTAQEHRLLKKKLKRLSDDTTIHGPFGRHLDASGREARLEAMLTEIDDSMLPETLTFRTRGASVRIATSGRRLVGITAASGFSHDAQLIGQAISPEDTALVESVSGLLSTFVDLDGELHLTVGGKERLAEGATIGLSIGQLRKQLGLDAATPAEIIGDTPLARLASGLGSAVRAKVMLEDGTVSEESGSETDLSALQEILENQLMAFDELRKARCSMHDDPSLTCLPGAGPDGSAVVVAMYDQDISLFLITPDAIALPHQVWRQIA